jgi:hypothetical protein
MPKHTPGPWNVWRLAPDSDPDQRQIVVAGVGCETEICGIIYNDADAALLAAAPELLEALKNLLSLLGDETAETYTINAWKAIKKAEGNDA